MHDRLLLFDAILLKCACFKPNLVENGHRHRHYPARKYPQHLKMCHRYADMNPAQPITTYLKNFKGTIVMLVFLAPALSSIC